MLTTMERAAGAMMIAAAIPLALGVCLFLSRNGIQGRTPRNPAPALFVLERGFMLSAVILTAFGLVLRHGHLKGTSMEEWKMEEKKDGYC